MPGRGRAGTGRALRHRAGRPAARLPAGRAGHAGRDAAGLPDEEGALGGRLVDPAAARTLARVRRARRRGARSSCARSWPRELHEAGQGRVGAPGVRRAARLHPGRPRSSRGGVRRGSTGCADAGCSAPSASSGRPATSSPASATSRRAGSSATTPSSRPRWPTPTTRADLLATKGFHGRGAAAVRRPLGRGARRGPRAARGRPAGAGAADRRSAARRAPGPSATRSPPSG